MEKNGLNKIGFILFFIGIMLIIYSWIRSYPISISSLNKLSFYQFHPFLWLGIFVVFIAIFLIGILNNVNKLYYALFSSIFPILSYITPLFYPYLSSSDSGAVRGSFHIFQKVGINTNVNSYFEFPNFFTLNEIIHQMSFLEEKGISALCFVLYGFMLGLLLFLFFYNLEEDKIGKYSFLMVSFYFIGTFSFLNYQWAPQTFGLIYLFLILYLSSYLIYKRASYNFLWKILIILVFISLTFTHAFLPIFVITFFGFQSFKNKNLVNIFFIIFTIYIAITVYNLTTHFITYIEAFQTLLQSTGVEYVSHVSKSSVDSNSYINQIISYFNLLRIPAIWIVTVTGSIILFLKKKMKLPLTALGLSGAIYLIIGFFYSILGLRSIQILFISFAKGLTYFISKCRKIALFFILFILIISIFGPMRISYNQTFFQTDNEAISCNFIINKTPNDYLKIGVSQINYGYVKNKIFYYKDSYSDVLRPENAKIFNDSEFNLLKNEYLVYNVKLGKELIKSGLTFDEASNYQNYEFFLNNKIYSCNYTYLLNGIKMK